MREDMSESKVGKKKRDGREQQEFGRSYIKVDKDGTIEHTPEYILLQMMHSATVSQQHLKKHYLLEIHY